MNLWAKRTGQLLMAVLFLMSCEDDSYLLGFKNPNKQFEVRYQEFTFPGDTTSVMAVDSLITDHFNLTGGTFRFLLGQYDDPFFGTVSSEVYTQFLPFQTSQLTGVTVDDYVKATIDFKLDFYYYGYDGDSEEKFTIHKLTDNLSTSKRYFYNSSISYDPTPIGEAKINVRNFALREVNNPDTLLISGTIYDSYAIPLFVYCLNNDSLGNPAFLDTFKGLAIVPSTDNNYILGVDPITTLSRLTLHYKDGTQDLARSFTMAPTPATNNFNRISATRTAELAAIAQTYEPIVPPSGLRYVQSGSPIVTNLDLSQFYDFIRGDGPDGEDSLKKILITSAELSIGIETPPRDLPPPTTLVLRVLKKQGANSFFMNNLHNPDTLDMEGFRTARSDRYYYTASSDAIVPASRPDLVAPMLLTYDKANKRYVGRPTLFLQNLFDRKEVDVDVAQFAIFPVAPDAGKSVNRVIFKKDDIKLGIYYTKILLPNLD